MEQTIFQNKMDSNDYLIEKKIEIMIDMHGKKFVNELNSVKEAINNLSREISEVKRNISENKPAVKQEQIRNFEPQPEKPQEQTQTKGQNRYGEYQPKDVSIEKFFYSGSNKK